MDTLHLTQVEFDRLPEYSASLPTGTTIGKRWRRKRPDGWIVGEYVPCEKENHVGIKWYQVQIVGGKPEDYRPIPVDAARQIADRFAKSTVVILAYDPVYQLTHTATYGKSAADKDAAARLGDACTALIADLSHRINHEDYRTTDQAARAESIEQLQRRITAIREAVEQIVVTEGEDAGVVLLSHESPTEYDPELEAHVFKHEHFSPLGDALVALHSLCKIPPSPAETTAESTEDAET